MVLKTFESSIAIVTVWSRVLGHVLREGRPGPGLDSDRIREVEVLELRRKRKVKMKVKISEP